MTVFPLGAAFPGLRYLGEIGHLGTPFDPRTSVTFASGRVISTDDGEAHLEGRSDDGTRWRAFIPILGGVGYTTLWQADFDRNGRPDLLIAAFFPKNGRCIDEFTFSFLLFNDRGQPVPWVIHTHMSYGRSFPPPLTILTDLNHDGRAELVVTNCEYSTPPRFGEDRQITGIYEAKDAMWRLVRPADMTPYTALVRRSHRFLPQHDKLLPSDPDHWADQGNVFDQSAPAGQLTSVLPADPSCRGVRMPIVDGAVRRDLNDPCDELGKDRIRLTDGTVCFGWPTLMIDRADGREIVAESEDHTRALLQEIIDQGRRVILAGQTDRQRCSPTTLWAPLQ